MKNTFNRSEIMKRAWCTFRLQHGLTASLRLQPLAWRECLRAAWQAAKTIETPDAELIALGAELETVHRGLMRRADKSMDKAHTALREKIDATPAQSKAGRSVKLRAIDLAMFFGAYENTDLGSFDSLSQSIARDCIATMPAIAAMSIISRLPVRRAAF